MEWNGIQDIPWNIEIMEWNKGTMEWNIENMEWNIWKKYMEIISHVWYNLAKFKNFNQKITFYFYTTVNINFKINLLYFKNCINYKTARRGKM